LFGDPEKVSNERFENAWRERLKKKADFRFVSKPMPAYGKPAEADGPAELSKWFRSHIATANAGTTPSLEE